MRLWRLSGVRHAEAFDGGYGLFNNGRWNTRGRPVTYCSTVPSLAALEKRVHVTDARLLPAQIMIEYDVPDDIAVRAITDRRTAVRLAHARNPDPAAGRRLGGRSVGRDSDRAVRHHATAARAGPQRRDQSSSSRRRAHHDRFSDTLHARPEIVRGRVTRLVIASEAKQSRVTAADSGLLRRKCSSQ